MTIAIFLQSQEVVWVPGTGTIYASSLMFGPSWPCWLREWGRQWPRNGSFPDLCLLVISRAALWVESFPLLLLKGFLGYWGWWQQNTVASSYRIVHIVQDGQKARDGLEIGGWRSWSGGSLCNAELWGSCLMTEQSSLNYHNCDCCDC